ncbi:MAG: NapC/NirT family cytochrome c [Bryobacterales bacterium]|nr:NapC/NirT family cytochrome c [Bryobacterales bacterium]
MPQNQSRALIEWTKPLVYLSNNWISFLGVLGVTSAFVFWLFLLPTSLRSEHHPYLGILTFLILPGIFIGGLALIPIGMIMRKRRGGLPLEFPPLDFSNTNFRRLVVFVGAATFANVVLASTFTYQAVAFMDSAGFCGLTCHKVMKPEYTAYQGSPHARVDCVGCHIGPGANWFVKSKLSGLWQVVSVTFDLYHRPIETPIPDLRPARETCEACHWPQKYGEDRIRVNTHYADDEKNTATQNVLLVRIGKIHRAHLGTGVQIRYRADAKRENIPWVEHSENGKDIRTYTAKDAKADAYVKMDLRVMDCMDCHNRPSHTFETPELALDRRISGGLIPSSLPFARKKGLELLKASYSSNADAETKIRSAWAAAYPNAAGSAQAVVDIYNRNVFPEMNITWGTYPNHIGHNSFPGCFRCHDERPSNTGAKTITQDCNNCHSLLAMDEASPKILTDIGFEKPKTD